MTGGKVRSKDPRGGLGKRKIRLEGGGRWLGEWEEEGERGMRLGW